MSAIAEIRHYAPNQRSAGAGSDGAGYRQFWRGASADLSAQERHDLHGEHGRAEEATPGVHAPGELVRCPPHDGERRYDLGAGRRLGAGVEERAHEAADDKNPEAQVRTLDDDDLSVDPAPEHPVERSPHR